ncbi:GTPase family protein [Microbacterium sp.]|uniref:GTPase family protein n=1 Tax=Microbacterium sp. TaxID=51671 RepID=UPI00391BA776
MAKKNAGKLQLDDKPFVDATSEARSRYGRFNLAIVGASGVGKSSLVNAVFGRDWAKVGRGLPVTRGVQFYNDDSLGIWDVEGFEIGSPVPPDQQLRNHLEAIAAHSGDHQISVVWYCVKANDDRLTPADIAMIRELDARGLPVILVLTKVDWIRNPITGHQGVAKDVQAFVDWLNDPVDQTGARLRIPYRRVILTSTRDKHGKGKGHGLGDLVTETLELAPERDKDAFRIAQRLNLPWKREMARPIIAAAAAAAAGAATVPLPVSDAFTLAPIQLTMMGRIAAIYDLEVKTMLSAGALAQFGVQVAGRALATSFLKLIPGAGIVVNAAVAGALTAATGESWMKICELLHTGKIDVRKLDQEWSKYAPSFVDVVRKLVERRAKKA